MGKLILIVLLFCTTSFTVKAQYYTLHSFHLNYDGDKPYGSLIAVGNSLYGMTSRGGANDNGLIFKINPDGTGFSILFDFIGSNGSQPMGSLISDGTFLYGTTSRGGDNNWGTIFKIMPDGTGFSKLFDFSGTSLNGASPLGDLFYDGNFIYGMTNSGGAYYYGTIFKIRTDGTGFSTIHNFSSLTDGAYPRGSLISDGTYLYGMTGDGAANSFGTIFKIMPDGTGFINLITFAGPNNGAYAYGNLIYDGTFLYGIATHGGANGQGTVFRLLTDGTGFTILMSFPASSINQNNSAGSLISDGTYLYGMTGNGGFYSLGTIFKIMTDGTGYEKLLDFDNSLTGQVPNGSLFSDGTFLYGMTSAGGAYDDGTIFKFKEYPAGLSENNSEETFTLFPNPSDGVFTLNSKNTDGDVSVSNLLGEVVLESQIQNSNTEIDLSGMANGIYFITVKTINSEFTQKIIIQK